jgi:formate hydrogenlyase subunit 3/multisubunit Na+/H+ antiporter MnhD subunit
MQRDVKKLVAYRRVTHITLIILGLRVLGKDIIVIILLTSIAHG